MDLEIGQVLTQILAFLIMLWILKRFAWKPLLNIMEERRQKIKSEFAFIEEQKQEAKKLVASYNEQLKSVDAQAKVKIQEAVNRGQQIAKEIQEEARQQAKAIVSKAHAEIEEEFVKAKIQLKNDIVNFTIAATEKMIKESLDKEKQKKLIAEFMEEADLK